MLRFCLLFFFLCAHITLSPAQAAEDVKFFRIGAGPAGGTLFPAAGWIGAAVSNPPGSRPCGINGSCGVPGLIGLVQTTSDGIDNIDGLRNGTLEAGIAYADMAHAALKGTGVFKPQGPFDKLKAVAALAPESLHILVRADSKIRTIQDLKGKRIAVGPRYSTSQSLAFLVLRLHGVDYGSYRWFLLNPGGAARALDEKKVDAVMFMSGPDSGVARQMIDDGVGVLLSLDPSAIAEAIKANPFLHASIIKPEAYGAKMPVQTVEIMPILLVCKTQPVKFIEELSNALWKAMQKDKTTHPLATETYIRGQALRMGVPLHAGAVAFRQQIINAAKDATFNKTSDVQNK